MTDDEIIEALERVTADVINEHAIEVDASAAFPSASIAALAEAGLLGLISAPEVGGLGHGPRLASQVIRRVSRTCGSTAMVLCMHYCGTAVLEKHGPRAVREAAARGEHLSTLAFSEAGSRSHFWAPVSTATKKGDAVILDARKSWITSASHAAAYVWSSKPVAAEGPSTIWLVPADAAAPVDHAALVARLCAADIARFGYVFG